MKRVIIFFLLILALDLFGQQQVKIDWPSLADTPWPIERGDMQGTGRSEYVGPRTNNIIWRKDMPLGVLRGPVIGYGDILYTGERSLSPVDTNYLYAIDKNGNNFWTFETESRFANSVGPVIGRDSTIYFGSNNEHLYALNRDGTLKWRYALPAFGYPTKLISIAKHGDIYISYLDTMMVISPQGFLKKTFLIPWSESPIFSTDGERIILLSGFTNEQEKALNVIDLDGNLLWKYVFFERNHGIPLIDNADRIYVFGTVPSDSSSSHGHLYCFNPDGTIAWKYGRIYFSKYSSPTIDKNGNIVFHAIFDIENNGTLESINSIISVNYDGELNWITYLNIDNDFWKNYISTGLVCDAEGKIYCGSWEGGYFFCLSSDGEILWTLDQEGYDFDSSPAIGSDGTLYFGTNESSVFDNHVRNFIAIRDKTVSVETEDLVKNFHLYQNYPNPFNPRTTIKFAIPKTRNVILKVYDVLGNEIKTLLNEEMQAGIYETEFDGRNQSSGIYFYTLISGKYTQTKKFVMMK